MTKELRPVSEVARNLIECPHCENRGTFNNGTVVCNSEYHKKQNEISRCLTARDEYWQELLAQKLSAVSVACISNTHKSMEDTKIERDNPFWSVAYEDVRVAIKREIDLREKLEHWLGVVSKLEEALNEIARIPTNMRELGENWSERMATHGSEARDIAKQALADLEAVKKGCK